MELERVGRLALEPRLIDHAGAAGGGMVASSDLAFTPPMRSNVPCKSRSNNPNGMVWAYCRGRRLA